MLCSSLLQTFPSQIRRMLTNLKAKYEKELFPELQVGALGPRGSGQGMDLDPNPKSCPKRQVQGLSGLDVNPKPFPARFAADACDGCWGYVGVKSQDLSRAAGASRAERLYVARG